MILDIIREKSTCPAFKISFADERFIVLSSCQRLTPESSRRYMEQLDSGNVIMNGNQNYNKAPLYVVYGVSSSDMIDMLEKKYRTIEALFEDIARFEPVNCEEFVDETVETKSTTLVISEEQGLVETSTSTTNTVL